MTWRSRVAEHEARVTQLLRSRVARVIGTIVGGLAFAAVVRAFLRADVSLVAEVADAGVVGLGVTVIGFVAFHGFAVATLRAVGAADARYIWGVSQLIKYLPVPGAAVVGMASAAVRSGEDGRGAFRLVVLASVVRVGGAMVVGAVAIPFWLGAAAWLEAVLVVVFAAAGWLIGLRSGGLRATLLAVGGWVAAGTAIAAATSTGEAVAVGAAYALAWVAGQLAIPIPAGIGVREFVLVALLTPVLGAAAATVVAVTSRLVHTLSDVVVASTTGLGRRDVTSMVESQ